MEYIEQIKNYLKETYGEVKPEWNLTIQSLEDTIKRYTEVKKIIDEGGIFFTDTKRKNPLLSTEKDLLSTILKLTQKLCISPWDVSKLKIQEDDNVDDYINNLTNG